MDRAQILAATLSPPPAKLDITHWLSRLLADHLLVDASTVLQTWRHHRLQPRRTETFKFSTDPELVAKSLTSSVVSSSAGEGDPAEL